MAQSNLMLSAIVFVLSWIVFFGISRLVRMSMPVRLTVVALLSLAAASHQLLVYYGSLHVLSLPHFIFYGTTFATNLLFFAAPIAALVYLIGFIRLVVRKSKHHLKTSYRAPKATRLSRAYQKLRYQLARSKVKERLQRRKAYAQAKLARQAAQRPASPATNAAPAAAETGTITWSSGDADKITFSDSSGICTVIDTRIYDQHGYRSDQYSSPNVAARTIANSLFCGDGDDTVESADIDLKALPGNVQVITSDEDLSKIMSLQAETNAPAATSAAAPAAPPAAKPQRKLNTWRTQVRRRLFKQPTSYTEELAQRARAFDAQDEQAHRHDARFHPTAPAKRPFRLWRKLPWRALGQSCALGCLFALNAVAGYSTVQALTMPQIKYIDVTLDVPVEFEGMQIVQLSDLNIGGLYPKARTTNIVSKVMAIQPDLVVLTGTIAHGDPDLIEKRLSPLFGLTASMGVYVLIGDEFNSNLYTQMLRRYNDLTDARMHFLTNDTVQINVGLARLCITGIADSKSQLAQFLNYATDPTMGLALRTQPQAPEPTDSARFLAAYHARQNAEHKAWQALASQQLHSPSAAPDLQPHGTMVQAAADHIANFLKQAIAARVAHAAKVAPIAPQAATQNPVYTTTKQGYSPIHHMESSRAIAAQPDTPAAPEREDLSITPYGTHESQALALANGMAPNSGYLPEASDLTDDDITCPHGVANDLCIHQAESMAPNTMGGGICAACLNADPQYQGPCARKTQDVMAQVTSIGGASYAHIAPDELNHTLNLPQTLSPLNVNASDLDGSFNIDLYQSYQSSAHNNMSTVPMSGCPCWHDLHWEESTSHQRLIYALTNDEVKDADFNLVLSDSPTYTVALSQIAEDNFDLMLTGNTYGGVAPVLSKLVAHSNGGFISGLYNITDRLQLYVSSGTNCWAPAPIRLGNTGEITLITVHSRYISDEQRSQRIHL